MGWSRYLLHDFFTAHALNEMEEKVSRNQRIDMGRRLGQGRRLRELEEDLGRVALLVRSLAELCVRKGVLTSQEIEGIMREIDLRDGVEDKKVTKPVRKLRP